MKDYDENVFHFTRYLHSTISFFRTPKEGTPMKAPPNKVPLSKAPPKLVFWKYDISVAGPFMPH